MKTLEILNIVRDRDFRYLWLSSIISVIGSGISSFALMWWIYKETGSPMKMGGVALVTAVTSMLTGPLLGSAVDYLKRHRDFLIVADLFSALVMAVIAMLMHFNLYSMVVYYGLTAVQTALTIAKSGCNQGLVQRIIKKTHYEKTSALWSFSNSGSSMLGPVIGGILIAWAGAPLAITIDAVSFLVSALMKIPISAKRCEVVQREERASLIRMSIDGFLYLKAHRTIFWMCMLFSGIGLFVGALPVLLIIFVTKELSLDASFYGAMQSANFLGIFCLSLTLSFLHLPGKNRHLIMLATMIVQASALCLMGRLNLPSMSIAALFCIGAGDSIYNVIFNSYALRSVDSKQIGRFYSFMSSLNFALRPISIFAFTLLVEKFSSSSLLQFIGVAMFCMSFLSLMIPAISSIGVDAPETSV